MQVDGFVLQPLVEPYLRTADSGQFLAELVNWQGGAHCMTGPILVEQLTAGAVARLSALAATSESTNHSLMLLRRYGELCVLGL